MSWKVNRIFKADWSEILAITVFKKNPIILLSYRFFPIHTSRIGLLLKIEKQIEVNKENKNNAYTL